MAVSKRFETTNSNTSGPVTIRHDDVNAKALSTYSSWFLDTGSWAIDRGIPGPERASRLQLTDLKAFPRTVRDWLREWIRENHCPLIHRQLYADVGMPSCLMDAFAALAMWQAKTDENEDLVMRYIEEKASQLINGRTSLCGSTVDSTASLRTVDHLARVQALFIYQHIRLFDGDVRQRPLAEACIPLTSQWTSSLWESASMDAFLQTSIDCSSGLFSQDLAEGLGGPPSMRPWRDWLLAESVRRIWLVVNYTQAVYIALRDGQSECSGGIAFTAREGLWDSQSAEAWTPLVNEKDPLFMLSSCTDHILPTVFARDVDPFGLSILTIMGDRQNLKV